MPRPRAAGTRRARAATGARRTRAARTLSPEWRAWIAQNLLAGAAPDTLVAELRAHGVPAREARARVAEEVGSGALALARARDRRARQLELLARLLVVGQRAGQGDPAVGIERRASVPREEFFARYYATNTPVVLTDLVTRWPAFGRWTPEQLKARFGAVMVQMTAGRDSDPDYDYNRAKHFAPVRMGEFVDRVLAVGESNDFYLIARNYNTANEALWPLFDDVDWSHGYLDRVRAPRGSALWFGPAGTVTPLHHDTSNILFAQVYGRKKLVLASPLELALWEGARAMYADLDPEQPEPGFARHPALRDVRLHTVVLEPGEALFIPVGWWHHVRALSVSISLALNNFARPNAFDWYVPGAL